MYHIYIHEDFMTSLIGTLTSFFSNLNVQNATICNYKILLSFNNFAFFYYFNIFFNKEIFKIANLSLLNHKFELSLNKI